MSFYFSEGRYAINTSQKIIPIWDSWITVPFISLLPFPSPWVWQSMNSWGKIITHTHTHTHIQDISDKREECDTYLTHVCRHQHSSEKIEELSSNNVTFTSCRSRLTKVLADVAREKKGRVGEAKWGYWKLIPRDCRDWRRLNLYLIPTVSRYQHLESSFGLPTLISIFPPSGTC